MWTENDIREYCRDLTEKYTDYEFDCPVAINGRLKTTLGRLCYYPYDECGETEPEVLEISKNLLLTASDKSIISIIEHEWCHWVCWKETHIPHGHDDLFKEWCATIGCKNDKARTNVERIKEVRDKYEIVCPKCGKLKGFKTNCKTVKNYRLYRCGFCGGDVEVVVNDV